MIFASQNERTRKAVVWKLTQISRLAEKSLLCNVSMNTRLDDCSLTGGLSYFGGHASATMPHATARNAPSPEYKLLQLIYDISGACTGHKCRRWQVPSKHLNPTLRQVREGAFIEHRNSKAIRLFASRKWQDNFQTTVPGIQVLKRQKSYSTPWNIRNIMGTSNFQVCEVWDKNLKLPTPEKKLRPSRNLPIWHSYNEVINYGYIWNVEDTWQAEGERRKCQSSNL